MAIRLSVNSGLTSEHAFYILVGKAAIYTIPQAVTIKLRRAGSLRAIYDQSEPIRVGPIFARLLGGSPGIRAFFIDYQ